MKKTAIAFLATGAYAGHSPFMPGTFGTLWGIPLAWLLSKGPLAFQAVFTLALIAFAIYVSSEAVKIYGGKDPSCIVIDEIAGISTAFLLIPFSAVNAILVFLLFRFFDILKPYPVGYLDKNLNGGAGVVLDDVAAGVYANICAQVVLRFIP